MITDAAVDFDLADLQGRRRVVLLFAPFIDHDRYAQQKQMLAAAQSGLEEREVTLVEVVGADRGVAGDQPLTPVAARRLRERFGVDVNSYATILVGKDGSEKLRDRRPVHAGRLFGTIDAMPMRAREAADKRDAR